MKKCFLPLVILATLLLSACGCKGKCDKSMDKEFITIDSAGFVKNGASYNYIGTNLWYASILGSTGEGGDRQRLCNELDKLKELGVTNLRILSGPDAGSDLANPAKPYLQEAPGVLNDTLLAGLDFVIAELEKRGMDAVIYLNNAWDWSGGYGFYLKQCGYGDSPNANVDGGYGRYVSYCAAFSRDTVAQNMYYDYIRKIVSRRNSITGRYYKDEPAIMSWQLCNEPRPFAPDNKEQFANWIAGAASLIKKLDPNHLVSTGSEGLYGCEVDMDLCERIHADSNIDYITIHIWPANWGWASRSNPDSDIENACVRSGEYIDMHVSLAQKLRKPLVIEEFGFPRQGNVSGTDIPTESRDTFYGYIFASVKSSVENGGPIAGCNFWGWGGCGRPRDLVWQPGDDYLCDPPHEPQGWYSVFDSDSTTINVIKEYSQQLRDIKNK